MVDSPTPAVVQAAHEPPLYRRAQRDRLSLASVLVSITRLTGGVAKYAFRGLLALLMLEGGASLIGFLLALPDGIEPPEKERLHMQYDPELGWSHQPGTRLENFYGPGRHLTINEQGFRAGRAYEAQPPPGQLRVVCTGDAFTLGTGVGDDDTWCAQLGALEPRLETVNLGQGGYGIDQAFLWYRREGLALGADLLLFAFVRADFGRMESDTFEHYGKPVLRLGDDGELEVRNVPVPYNGQRAPWIVRNAALFEQLRIVQLANPALHALRPEDSSKLNVTELTALSAGIFESLQRLCDEHDTTLVLLYLPTREDYETPGDMWQRRIAAEARQRDIALVDLVEEQRALSRAEVAKLYVPRSEIDTGRATAPFSEAGNSWVAKTLLERLRQLPGLAEALGAPVAPAPVTPTARRPPAWRSGA